MLESVSCETGSVGLRVTFPPLFFSVMGLVVMAVIVTIPAIRTSKSVSLDNYRKSH